MVITYTEKIDSFTTTPASTWNNYDIFTLKGIPKGAIVEIALCNAVVGVEHTMGVRTDGSGLNRYILIHEAEGGGEVVFTMPVKVHATTGLIECYTTATGNYFRILGYFTGVDFTETMATTAISTIGAWTDLDLGTHGGLVHSIIISSAKQDASATMGIRTNGSSLNRYLEVHEPEAGGESGFMFYVKSDANDVIEYWLEEGTSKSLIDLGYFDSTVDFVEAWLQVNVDTSVTWVPRQKAWTQVAPKYGSETSVWSLCVLNNEIYGGVSPNGNLLKWNGVNAWTQVAPLYGEEIAIWSLCVLDGEIYGGTTPNGNLLKWNGVNAWTQVAPKYGAETSIYSLCVLNGEIYGGTYPNGNLLKWNGINAWTLVAPKYGLETYIYSLCVLNGEIYGGTSSNGNLLKWNGVNAWTQVAPKYGSETDIYSLCVLDGVIYGGTYPNSNLLKWNGVNAWTQAAPKYGLETYIVSLYVLDGVIYGGTEPNGNLLKWNGVNAWTQVAPKYGSETSIFSLCVLNNEIYGGTEVNGNLLKATSIFTANTFTSFILCNGVIGAKYDLGARKSGSALSRYILVHESESADGTEYNGYTVTVDATASGIVELYTGLNTADYFMYAGYFKPVGAGPTPGWNKLQYLTEPPTAGAFNKLKFASEPPIAGAWNKVLYSTE